MQMHRGRSVCRVSAMQPVIHAALLSNCTPFFQPLHSIAKQTNRSETKTALEVSPRETKGKTVKKLPFTLYTKKTVTLTIVWNRFADRPGSNQGLIRSNDSGWLDRSFSWSGPTDEIRIEARAILPEHDAERSEASERASGALRLFSASSRARVASPHATRRRSSALHAKHRVAVASRNDGVLPRRLNELRASSIIERFVKRS